jgi:hypothetical protein
MRSVTKLGLAGGLLLASMQMAAAGTITYTDTLGPTSTPWGPTAFTFSSFNPTDGTLDSVTVTVTESLTGTGSATNNSTSSVSGTIGLQDTATATFDPSTNLTTVVINDQNSGVLGLAAAGQTGDSVTGIDISGQQAKTTVVSSGLSGFETGSSWGGSVTDTSALIAQFGSANVNVSGTDNGQTTIELTYDYSNPSTVAEPFSIALLTTGLLSLGLVRRRRSR